MTAHTNPTNPTSPAMPIFATQPMLEFNAPPTLENLTVISKLGQVAARVRFTVHTRSVEKYKPSPRHRRESTRTVEGELELTVRVVGHAQAPIVMTARHANNVLEIYRRFEGQLFKLETLREYSFGKVTRILTLEDVQQQTQNASQGYGQTLEHVRSRAEAIVNSRILVEGLVYVIASEPMYVTGTSDVLSITCEPFGLERPHQMLSLFNALERDLAVQTIKRTISKRRVHKTGGLGAVIRVYRQEAVTRPSHAMQRQAVEDLMVRQTLEQVQRAFSGSLVSSMVKARVMEVLNTKLEAECAKRKPKPKLEPA